MTSDSTDNSELADKSRCSNSSQLAESASALESVKHAAVARQVTHMDAAEILDHVEVARERGTASCGDDRRLHEAVVEEVLSLSEVIEHWTHEISE